MENIGYSWKILWVFKNTVFGMYFYSKLSLKKKPVLSKWVTSE